MSGNNEIITQGKALVLVGGDTDRIIALYAGLMRDALTKYKQAAGHCPPPEYLASIIVAEETNLRGSHG